VEVEIIDHDNDDNENHSDLDRFPVERADTPQAAQGGGDRADEDET
jgi:hypothetical protein